MRHQSENGIRFHNEAAIRIEQTASPYKRLRQQDGENILMTNYILRCANGLYSKLRLRFNPVSKEQYYFKIPHHPYGLFYMTQISGLFSFFFFQLHCTLCARQTNFAIMDGITLGFGLYIEGDHAIIRKRIVCFVTVLEM